MLKPLYVCSLTQPTLIFLDTVIEWLGIISKWVVKEGFLQW